MANLLLFELDQLRLALPLEQVRETVRAVEITPLAGAPGVVEGVVNVRGTVAPVLDLRARFRLPPRPIAITDHMVIAHAGARTVVMRVDHVLDVHEVPDASLTPAPPGEPAFAHLAGVARLPDGMVLVSDLEAFLTQGEREALAAALDSVAGGGSGQRAPAGREAAGDAPAPDGAPAAAPAAATAPPERQP